MNEQILAEGKYNYQFDIVKKLKIFIVIAAISGLLALVFANISVDFDPEPLVFIFIGIAGFVGLLALIHIVKYIYCKYTRIVVTDKRVYGTTIGKEVDLPFDSISSASTTFFLGVGVSTASGTVCFRGIDNRDEIYETINKLLIERQGTSKQVIALKTEENIDDLKKYKSLLDEGLISEEDYIEKKKQLLGL